MVMMMMHVDITSTCIMVYDRDCDRGYDYACAVIGYFAKEEKFRAMVKVKMPKLNAQLAPLLESYEVKWGPFLYDDIPYTIVDDEEVSSVRLDCHCHCHCAMLCCVVFLAAIFFFSDLLASLW
jgi:hypothetical protein